MDETGHSRDQLCFVARPADVNWLKYRSTFETVMSHRSLGTVETAVQWHGYEFAAELRRLEPGELKGSDVLNSLDLW